MKSYSIVGRVLVTFSLVTLALLFFLSLSPLAVADIGPVIPPIPVIDTMPDTSGISHSVIANPTQPEMWDMMYSIIVLL